MPPTMESHQIRNSSTKCTTGRINSTSSIRSSSSTSVNSVIYGWLWKQGSSFKSWKKRFFVLRGNLLQYFDQCTIMESTKEKTKGIIRKFEANPKGSLDVGHAEETSHTRYGIIIFSTEGRKIFINADSDTTRKQWLNAFIQAKHTNKIQNFHRGSQLTDFSESSRSSSDSNSPCSFRELSSNSNHSDESIERKEGWLMKQGNRVHTWKRRYFVFDDGILLYKPNSLKETASIKCAEVHDVTLWDGKPYGLCIRFGEKRDLFVVAMDENERMEWYQVMCNALNVAQTG